MSIIATDPSGLLNRFYALRIHDGRAEVWVPSLPFAFGPVKRPQQERPGALETQAAEMVEDRLSRWKVGWQVAPRTAGAQRVKDGVENGT